MASSSGSSYRLIRQMMTAGLQSGSIMFFADAMTQMVLEGRRVGSTPPLLSKSASVGVDVEAGEQRTEYSLNRSLRWGLAGLTIHGPYFFASFRAMDAVLVRHTTIIAEKSMAIMVATKTAIAQFVIFPPYLVALFTYMGFMEGLSSQDLQAKVKQRVPEAFIGGCAFWPVANGINFWFVPISWRVPYLAGVGSVWNIFLSWLNAQQNDPTKITTKK